MARRYWRKRSLAKGPLFGGWLKPMLELGSQCSRVQSGGFWEAIAPSLLCLPSMGSKHVCIIGRQHKVGDGGLVGRSDSLQFWRAGKAKIKMPI